MAFKPFITFVKSFILDLIRFHALVSVVSRSISGTNRFIISLINLGFFRIRKSTVGEVVVLSVIFKF